MTRGERPRLLPPHPEIVRRPQGGFGWLEQRLLLDGWLSQLGPNATSVLVLLALAADRHGASFFGRVRMATLLGLSCEEVDLALARLKDLRLVAHRPWRPGLADGIWQLLPVPIKSDAPRAGLASIAEMLARLGFTPSSTAAENRRHRSPPENCGS